MDDYISGKFAMSLCTMGQILSAMKNSSVETAKVSRELTIVELKGRGFTHLAMEWQGAGRSKVSRLILWPKQPEKESK